ncbi:unnamed protein product [Parascedosporium putredinis]|uniref:Zn(2)-C6 fungal-type domain-containing protein n=1 Tax=Parascedosporium putredinis TaxID=1442378 RepID=A0A9P1GYB3_9PEZI|nr:unnamed protein product [Parascedosporium putredinis]CAI7989789.1 unnamed protein product [Parascedosporium putredinis]
MKPAESGESQGAKRPPRRHTRKVRASIACSVCRARKVRCNVAADGPPCTNCRLDGIKCTIPQEKRPRLHHRHPAAVGNALGISKLGAAAPATYAEHRIHHRIPGQHISRVTQLLQESSETSPPAASDDLNRMVIDEAEKEQPAARTGWRMYPWNKLPSFIVPITTPVPRATADYLAANEAFAFPGFIRFVYPLYPMFDLGDLEALASEGPIDGLRTSFTILTFQAMLLAAIPEDPTIIGDKTSGGDPLLRMRAASCLTLTARLVTIVAQILHTDFADIPSNSDNKSAIFESCEKELISWSAEFLQAFPGSYRSKFETGPFFTVSLLMHDTAINALYLPRVLESRQPHSALAYKIPQYRERMRRAAIRTVVLITEAFESEWGETIPTQFPISIIATVFQGQDDLLMNHLSFTAVISALPVHMIGVNSKNREISMTSRRCIGTCVRFLHRVQSTYGMARHLQQDVLSTLSRMKVAPRIPGASGAAGGASSGSAAEPSSSSEGFAGYTLLGFRAGPRGPRAADPTLGEHTDGLSEASLGKRLLYEGGHAGLDDAWSSCGMDLLSVEDLAEMTQGLQGWFDDIDIVAKGLRTVAALYIRQATRYEFGVLNRLRNYKRKRALRRGTE